MVRFWSTPRSRHLSRLIRNSRGQMTRCSRGTSLWSIISPFPRSLLRPKTQLSRDYSFCREHHHPEVNSSHPRQDRGINWPPWSLPIFMKIVTPPNHPSFQSYNNCYSDADCYKKKKQESLLQSRKQSRLFYRNLNLQIMRLWKSVWLTPPIMILRVFRHWELDIERDQYKSSTEKECKSFFSVSEIVNNVLPLWSSL